MDVAFPIRATLVMSPVDTKLSGLLIRLLFLTMEEHLHKLRDLMQEVFSHGYKTCLVVATKTLTYSSMSMSLYFLRNRDFLLVIILVASPQREDISSIGSDILTT